MKSTAGLKKNNLCQRRLTMDKRKYLDELILEKKNESAELKRVMEKRAGDKKIEDDIRTGVATIGGQQIEFEEKILFNNLISIYTPKVFLQKEIDEDYIIFQSPNFDINIIITLLREFSNDLTINEFKKQMEEKMKHGMNISAKWDEEGFIFVNNHKVTYAAFTTPVEADICYNFIFFAGIEGKALISNFNCTGEILNDWERAGKGMMNSLRIHVD